MVVGWLLVVVYDRVVGIAGLDCIVLELELELERWILLVEEAVVEDVLFFCDFKGAVSRRRRCKSVREGRGRGLCC